MHQTGFLVEGARRLFLENSAFHGNRRRIGQGTRTNAPPFDQRGRGRELLKPWNAPTFGVGIGFVEPKENFRVCDEATLAAAGPCQVHGLRQLSRMAVSSPLERARAAVELVRAKNFSEG